jgi:hypothetical protein
MSDLFDPPPRVIPQTQIDAYEEIQPRIPTLEEMCVRELTIADLTADEIALRCGKSPLSIRPRITIMQQKHMCAPTGETRANRSGAQADVVRLLPREYWLDDVKHMTNAECARELAALVESAFAIITHIVPTDETRRWVAEVESYRRRKNNA